MEDALRAQTIQTTKTSKYVCLNPCSNGRCSARTQRSATEASKNGLNPCSNGRCSTRSRAERLREQPHQVLILVLMEDALRAVDRTPERMEQLDVLILVLMEDALRALSE